MPARPETVPAAQPEPAAIDPTQAGAYTAWNQSRPQRITLPVAGVPLTFKAKSIELQPDGRTVWIEFKRLGEKPRLSQTLEHDRMKAAGAEVHTCDSVVEALKILGIV